MEVWLSFPHDGGSGSPCWETSSPRMLGTRAIHKHIVVIPPAQDNVRPSPSPDSRFRFHGQTERYLSAQSSGQRGQRSGVLVLFASGLLGGKHGNRRCIIGVPVHSPYVQDVSCIDCPHYAFITTAVSLLGSILTPCYPRVICGELSD